MRRMNSTKTIRYFTSLSLPIVFKGTWTLAMPGGCGLTRSFNNLDDLWRIAKFRMVEQFAHVPWALSTIALIESGSPEGRELLVWLKNGKGETAPVLGLLRRNSRDGRPIQSRRWAADYESLITQLGGDGKLPLFGLLLRAYMLQGAGSLGKIASIRRVGGVDPYGRAQGLGERGCSNFGSGI